MKRKSHDEPLPDITPILEKYGVEQPPLDGAYGRWRPIRCPLHDDRNASGQTDGVGFRCFTCSVFFANAYQFVMEKEQIDHRAAKKLVDAIAGPGSGEVRGERGPGGSLLGRSRDFTSERSFLPTRRRRGTGAGT